MAFVIEVFLIFVVVYSIMTQIVGPTILDKPMFPIFRPSVPRPHILTGADLARSVADAQAAADKLAAAKRDLVNQTQTARTEAAELERNASNIGTNL